MSWRSWSKTNRCPVCGGHAWSGSSSAQCRGGQREETPTAAYCSVKESSSPREKTWLWLLDAEYVWAPEPGIDPGPPAWERPASRAPRDLRPPAWEQSATWDYQDEHGNYAYSVVRFDREPGILEGRTKDYRPGRRFTTGSDLYRWGLSPEARLPYRLPQLLLARRRYPSAIIWIAEGEKSVDALTDECETATTMPGGSASWLVGDPGRWLPPETEANVIVDRDTPALGWAKDVLKTIPRGVLCQSATLNPGDDVVDHLAAGYTLAELIPLELP